MIRYPIYFVVDISPTNSQCCLIEVKRAIKQFISVWRCDPYIIESADITLIECDSKIKVSLSKVSLYNDIQIPNFKSGNTFSFSTIFMTLKDYLLNDVERKTINQPGDRIPLILFFIDSDKMDMFFKQESSLQIWYQKNTQLVFIDLLNKKSKYCKKTSIINMNEINESWIRCLYKTGPIPRFCGMDNQIETLKDLSNMPECPENINIII